MNNELFHMAQRWAKDIRRQIAERDVQSVLGGLSQMGGAAQAARTYADYQTAAELEKLADTLTEEWNAAHGEQAPTGW